MLVCWWEQYHDTATSGPNCSDLRSRDEFWLVCVFGELASVSRYCFVQDPETEGPHLKNIKVFATRVNKNTARLRTHKKTTKTNWNMRLTLHCALPL